MRLRNKLLVALATIILYAVPERDWAGSLLDLGFDTQRSTNTNLGLQISGTPTAGTVDISNLFPLISADWDLPGTLTIHLERVGSIWTGSMLETVDAGAGEQTLFCSRELLDFAVVTDSTAEPRYEFAFRQDQTTVFPQLDDISLSSKLVSAGSIVRATAFVSAAPYLSEAKLGAVPVPAPEAFAGGAALFVALFGGRAARQWSSPID